MPIVVNQWIDSPHATQPSPLSDCVAPSNGKELQKDQVHAPIVRVGQFQSLPVELLDQLQ